MSFRLLRVRIESESHFSGVAVDCVCDTYIEGKGDIQRAVINARHGRVRRPGSQLVRIPGPMNLAKKRNTAQSASHDRAVTSLSYRGTNVCMQLQHAYALKCNTAHAIM